MKITKRIKKIAKIVIGVILGCIIAILAPFIGILTFYVFVFAINSFFGEDHIIYIQETNTYYKLEQVNDNARLYISRTDTFGSDYVEFHYTPATFPEFYFVAPDTLIFIDDNGFYGRDVKSDQFIIEQMDRRSSPGLGPDSNYDDYLIMIEADRIRDSINTVLQARPHYSIRIHDYATGITIFNPQKEKIASKGDPFVPHA